MNRFLAVTVCALAAGTAAAHDGAWRGDYGRGYGPDDDVGPYAGVSFGQVRYNEEGLNTITPATGMFVVGASLSPNLAIEGRVGTGLGSSSTDSYGVQVNSLIAGYLKGSLPLTRGVSLYGLGGLASVDFKRDFGLVNAHDNGFSYGIGVDFDLDRRSRLNVEWTRLSTGDNLGYNYDVDQLAIGVAWRF
ncbi:MAG: porin family protein [Proteobacteria bacterium]|nr:porin family protein [Pseudomonadota bacterium]